MPVPSANIKPHLVVAPDPTSTEEDPRYKWHLTTAAGEVLVQDPDSYSTEAEAEKAATNFAKLIAKSMVRGVEIHDQVLARTPPEITVADVDADGTVVLPEDDPVVVAMTPIDPDLVPAQPAVPPEYQTEELMSLIPFGDPGPPILSTQDPNEPLAEMDT
jgi:hypothetical protein